MKQLTFLSKFFFLALAISFMTSCGDDGTGGGTGGENPLPPAIALQTGADLVSSATTVDASAVFKVRIIADKGHNDMTTFTVLEDGVAVDAARLNYNSAGAGALTNPYTLSSGETTTFDTNIEITAHDAGTRTYTFRITDSANETAETTVDISITSAPMALGFEGANGGITSNATLNDAGWFKVQLIASKGGSPLSTFSVLEDGTAVDASRVKFGTDNDFTASSDFPSNPLDLINDEKDGFNWFVWVNSHDAGSKTYTYIITAENGDTEELSLDIDIFSGTPIAELTGQLLLNAGGPSGTGGINLLTGMSTGSGVADGGHLRDQGIDINQVPADNWIKKVAPVGSNTLKVPATDFSGYDAVQFAEDILLAYDNGTPINESDVVSIGDEFLLRLITGETVLVKVADINETTNDNGDSYTLSIKR